MGSHEGIKKVRDQLSGLLTPDKQRIEQLRIILETEKKRQVSYSEAKEVGESLIRFYDVLAGDRRILGVNNKKEGKLS